MNLSPSLHSLTTVSFVTLTALASSTAAFAQTFDNGLIRFGNGSEASVNEFGNLRQPFYYSGAAATFYKLTYSNYPLDVQFGAGTGTHWTGSGIGRVSLDCQKFLIQSSIS